MPGKKVSWANERGGALVQQRYISPIGAARKVSTKKKKTTQLEDIDRVIRERQLAASKKLELLYKKCQGDIKNLQKKLEDLIKQESIIASSFINTPNKNIITIPRSLYLKMKKINEDTKKIENAKKDKGLLLQQLRNKKKALNYSISSSRK